MWTLKHYWYKDNNKSKAKAVTVNLATITDCDSDLSLGFREEQKLATEKGNKLCWKKRG